MNQAIFKIKDRDQPFVVIDKRTIEDSRLSWAARGLLAYMLSKPSDWQMHSNYLTSKSPAGRDAVRTLLRELEGFGYIKRDMVKPGGKLAKEQFLVYEIPELAPATVCPAPENPQLLNNNTTKKDKTKKKNTKEYTPEFLEFWDTYPRKEGKEAAYAQWNARLKQGEDLQVMLQGALEYKHEKAKAGTEAEFIKLPSTFLGIRHHYREAAERREKRLSEYGDHPTVPDNAPKAWHILSKYLGDD